MLTYSQFLVEKQDNAGLPWDKDPQIGWWKDHDHVTLYHGTHVSRVDSIKKHGLKPHPTKGISMALEPHTAHAYASMHGGEASFRGAGHQTHHVPHHERAVMVYRVPRHFIEMHADKHLAGNTDDVRDNLTNKEKYLAHKRAGKTDHEHYAKTELRFNHVPNEYLVGPTRKVKD